MCCKLNCLMRCRISLDTSYPFVNGNYFWGIERFFYSGNGRFLVARNLPIARKICFVIMTSSSFVRGNNPNIRKSYCNKENWSCSIFQIIALYVYITESLFYLPFLVIFPTNFHLCEACAE